MHPEFGNIVKAAADEFGDELSQEQIVDLFHSEYIDYVGKYGLCRHRFANFMNLMAAYIAVSKVLLPLAKKKFIRAGVGNGPIDSFFQALAHAGVQGYHFVNYHEHAVSHGSNAEGICYIELKKPNGEHIFGAGMHPNVNVAALLASSVQSIELKNKTFIVK